MCISHLYIVEPIAHGHVLNPDYDVDLPIEGYEYNWTSTVCLQPAKSGVALEFQFIENTDSCVYFDFDQFLDPLAHLCLSVTTDFTLTVLPKASLLQNLTLLDPTSAHITKTKPIYQTTVHLSLQQNGQRKASTQDQDKG